MKRTDKKILPKRAQIFHGRIAVYIDAANLEKSVADLGTDAPKLNKIPKGYVWKAYTKGYFKIDYKKLYSYFKNQGTVTSVGFYTARFETENHDKFLSFLKAKKYHLVTKSIKHIHAKDGDHRKANFDVEIAVDAVSQTDFFDTFVLFSGDSDFAYTHLTQVCSFLKRKSCLDGSILKKMVANLSFLGISH